MNQDRFYRLWNRCAGFSDPKGNTIFSMLENLYDEPTRFYHTSAHINQCLTNMDEASAVIGASDVVELSIWFHDAIYFPGAQDNEKRSADYFSDLAAASLPQETVSQVTQCILSTTHKSMPEDENSKFVVDIDLSGFGQEWEKFVHDGENIRKENSHLNIDQYVAGQIKFMEKLINRNQIYSTDYFNSRLESIAQKNISRQLKLYYQHLGHL